MYYSAEFNQDTVMQASDALKSKVGVCEVMPSVRFSMNKRGEGFVLVCTHPNPSLNCGTAAVGCDNCIRKEEVARSNKEFSKYLLSIVCKNI